jgi:hypothetical protein
MPSDNNLDFICNWSFGFNLDPRAKGGNVGYLLWWSGIGGLSLPKDIEVWNPYNAAGQTVVTGPKVQCIGLLESFKFAGGEDDPIRIVAYVSKSVAADIRAKLSRPVSTTKLKLAWYIIAYDDDAKLWYEAALIKDKAKADANIDTASGQLQMFISNEPTRISESLELKVYRFEFQVVPAEGNAALLEFATGPSQKLVKQWSE